MQLATPDISFLCPQRTFNIVPFSRASQSEDYWETQRHAGDGKTHSCNQQTGGVCIPAESVLLLFSLTEQLR